MMVFHQVCTGMGHVGQRFVEKGAFIKLFCVEISCAAQF